MHEVIYDHRAQRALKNFLYGNQKYRRLVGLRLCGTTILKQPGTPNNVYVVKDGNHSNIFGTTHCNSTWACPKCTPRVMAERAARIACLIDAKEKLHNEQAFMLTFTLPHTEKMTCAEALRVLNDTWRMFTRDGKRARNKQNKAQGAYGQFRAQFQITSIVRVYEVTWGDANGWHPHIHALLWTKKENFPDLLEWEDKLTRRWIDCAKHCHLKIITRDKMTSMEIRNCLKYNHTCKYTKEFNFIQSLYADYKLHLQSGHRAVFFSKENNGTVRKESSSHYISGWGAKDELTASNLKTKHNMGGRFSPFEMITLAREAKTKEVREHWLNLFCEYADATLGHKRFHMSPNDNALIELWKQTHDYIINLKKKLSDRESTQRKIVYWFNEQQWKHVSFIEQKIPIIEMTLRLAMTENPRRQISNMLKRYGVPPNHTESPFEQVVTQYLNGELRLPA